MRRAAGRVFAAGSGLLLLLAPLAAPADGQRRSDPCRRPGEETACFVAHEAELLAVYGFAAAAGHLAAGTEIRRAMFNDGYERDTVAVEFRRAAGGGPEVAIYLPRGHPAGGAPEPALTGPVPLSDWEEIAARGRYFDRRLVPEPEPRDAVAG